MRIIVLDAHARRDTEPLIAHIAARLGRFGIGIERVRVKKQPRLPYEEYAALFATGEFPHDLRDRLPCYGKSQTNMPSRPETLEWLRQAGLPTMRWSLAKDHHELGRLFDVWQTDAVLVKRSDTFGGSSVQLFTRQHVPEIQWNPRRDLFCPEVNPEDGDVYKLEMFGPTFLLGWMSHVPAARARMNAGKVDGLFGAYGRRDSFEWPESILEPARRFGDFARDLGYGHMSLDFMRNPRGELEAIEVNLGNVALWWTTQFPSFRRRYADAIHQLLVERHDASPDLAKVPTRIQFRLLGLAQKPKLLLRKLQGAWSRRRNTRNLEGRHAGSIPVRRNQPP